MIVGVDCDEVIYPFVNQFRSHMVEARGHDPATLPEPTVWRLGQAWGMTDDEWDQEFTAAIKSGVLFGEGEPIEGAVPGLMRLHEAGHSIFVVTGRDIEGAKAEAAIHTHRWLSNLGVPFSGVIISHDKGIVQTDIFFEDFHHHYDDLDDEFETLPILMTRPWNIEHPGRRVDDWGEFVEAVEFLTSVCDASDDDPQFSMREAWEALDQPEDDLVTEL